MAIAFQEGGITLRFERFDTQFCDPKIELTEIELFGETYDKAEFVAAYGLQAWQQIEERAAHYMEWD